MRARWLLAVALVVAGCGRSSLQAHHATGAAGQGSPEPGGGSSGLAGAAQGPGGQHAGGALGTGGNPSGGGGTVATGGTLTMGGANGGGGSRTSGGAGGTSGAMASGGAIATGGTRATGGIASGGTVGSGGSRAIGGTAGTSTTGRPLGSGGRASTGGIAGGAGTVSTGGTVQSGGTVAPGGTTHSGGMVSTGGTVQSGGTVSTGGTLQSGGMVATGGALQSGGTMASGGRTGSGGPPATGGAVGAGGTPASGGSTGRCGDGVLGREEQCDLGNNNRSQPAFLVTQSGSSFPATPVVRVASAKDFYNYTSASAHTGFEALGVSRIMLYLDKSSMSLSLVVFHGIDNNTSGQEQPESQVQIVFSGLPSTTTLAASDEEGELTMTSETSATGDWSFRNNSDGGALAGLPLPGDWEIYVSPAFVSGITAWTWLQSDGSPVTLDPTQPITIKAFTAAAECRIDCTAPLCGDGVLDGGEICDDGEAAPSSACTSDCMSFQ